MRPPMSTTASTIAMEIQPPRFWRVPMRRSEMEWGKSLVTVLLSGTGGWGLGTRADYSRDQTTRPFTIVATGPPRNVLPWNGELRLLDADLFTSYVQERSVSKIVMSAGAPIASPPRSRFKTLAGPCVNSSTIRASDIFPECTSLFQRDSDRRL